MPGLRFTILWLWLAACWPAPGLAQAAERSGHTGPAVLEIFVREGCPHCDAAKAYLPRLRQAHPELSIRLRPVDHDEQALADLLKLNEDAGTWPPGVPTFVFRGRLLVGFGDAEQSGPQIEALIKAGRVRGADVDTGLFGVLRVAELGLPAFTLALGLIDGINPCATWVLLFLLSLLVHLRDRGRMALIAGAFVLVSGLFYFAFMAAWLNAFLLFGLGAPLRLALGALAVGIGALNLREGWRSSGGYTLAIPESAKPGLYARMRQLVQAPSLLLGLSAAAGLAVAVNFVELLCTAGFPALYTAILAQQDLGKAARYTYLALYNLGYIADDALMVALAVWAMSSRRLSEGAGRWLKLISGTVMLGLGVIMIARPQWLALSP